jgi:hypothetical protein
MLTDTIIQPLEGVTMTKFCPKCQAKTERNKKGDCKPCNNARCAAWRKVNLEREKANNVAWYTANLKRARATRAVYQSVNSEKLKAKKAEYYLTNAEKIKAISALRYASNPKQCNAANAAWRKANPERKKAIDAAWHKANPEAHRINGQNRRARKRANGGTLSKNLSTKLFKLQRGKCPCCKKHLSKNYHLDHIVPLALGGSNTDDNIQLLRATCNQQKHAKHPIDFMQQKGFLL